MTVSGTTVRGDSSLSRSLPTPAFRPDCTADSPVQNRFQKGQKLKKQNAVPQPPKHLRVDTKRFYASIVNEFALDLHHIRLLTKACEAFDRAEEAREAIAKFGMVYENRFGNPVARPECGIERDSRLAFARLIREIGLDVSPPAETRPTTLRGNR
jgi:phage terminase small subunit